MRRKLSDKTLNQQRGDENLFPLPFVRSYTHTVKVKWHLDGLYGIVVVTRKVVMCQGPAKWIQCSCTVGCAILVDILPGVVWWSNRLVLEKHLLGDQHSEIRNQTVPCECPTGYVGEWSMQYVDLEMVGCQLHPEENGETRWKELQVLPR